MRLLLCIVAICLMLVCGCRANIGEKLTIHCGWTFSVEAPNASAAMDTIEEVADDEMPTADPAVSYPLVE